LPADREQFGLSKSSVFDHGKRHVARDGEVAAAVSGESLIQRLEQLELHARRILSKAERAGDYRSEDPPSEEVDLLGVARTTVEIVAKRRAKRSRTSGVWGNGWRCRTPSAARRRTGASSGLLARFDTARLRAGFVSFRHPFPHPAARGLRISASCSRGPVGPPPFTRFSRINRRRRFKS
jgi:hypothetical protein